MAAIAVQALDHHLQAGVGRVYTAAVIHVRRAGKVVYERAAGRPNPEASLAGATPDTLFDLASLTKVFTATAFLTLVTEGAIALDDPVRTVFPEFPGLREVRPYEDPLHPGRRITVSTRATRVEAGRVTFRHLLTHTSGLPAWRPLYRYPAEQRRAVVLGTPFACAPEEHVVYSDLGFMLLGWAVEALTDLPLPEVLRQKVLGPLALTSVHFRPTNSKETSDEPLTRIAATEVCPWRRRRLWGEVHDENAWALGGVSGHAGLFGTAADVATLGQAWLEALSDHGSLPLSGPLAREAVQEQAGEGPMRRGLGWALRSPDPTSITYPLGPRAFGHTGFTGTSLYVDPDRALVVVALTNRVYYGRDPHAIAAWRRRLHELVMELVT